MFHALGAGELLRRKGHDLAPLLKFAKPREVLPVHALQLVMDELALIEHEQRVLGQHRKEVARVFQKGEDEVGDAPRLDLLRDRLQAAERGGGACLFALGAQLRKHALFLPFNKDDVGRRRNVDGGELFVALPRHLVIRLDALHFVPEKVDTYRMIGVHGEDV